MHKRQLAQRSILFNKKNLSLKFTGENTKNAGFASMNFGFFNENFYLFPSFFPMNCWDNLYKQKH